MEEQNLDEFFHLMPIFPEIYTLDQQFSDFGNGSQKSANTKQSIGCHAQEIIRSKPSSSSPTSPPQLICFENSNFSSFSLANSSDTNYNHNPQMPKDNYLPSQTINFSSSLGKDDSGKKLATRTLLQAQDHLVAERKRRKDLSQLFIRLSKVVPGLKKLDKASLLEDAIDHIKALEERVTVLEEEEMMKIRSSVSLIEDSRTFINYSGMKTTPDIQARIWDKHVLIKIMCRKQMDLMSRIPGEMEKIGLNVTDIRIMPFGAASLDITILVEMDGEFQGSVKDIVDHLHTVLLNPR